jgi:25S rRNA (cytosine2278-C5)-methyltransferase
MGGSGRVTAFDADPRRAEILRRTVAAMGAGDPPDDRREGLTVADVDVRCADFLATDPAAFGAVTHAVVDPSCSGSGIVGRNDLPPRQEELKKRLEKLSTFQRKCVAHAMACGAAKSAADAPSPGHDPHRLFHVLRA